MSGLGVIGVTGVSVPATMAAANTDLQNSLFTKVKSIVENAYKKAKDKFEGFETALANEYTSKWTEGSAEVEKRPGEILSKYQDGKQWINDNSDKVKQYAVEANYYGFTFGNIVKQVLAHIPTILTDTTIDLIYPEAKGEQNLLSIEKVVMMSKSDKLNDFISGVMEALKSHSSEIENISHNDAQGIVKILKNINYDKQSIDNFFKKVKENSSSLETSYQCTTKLLVDLFVGKDQIGKIKEYASTLQDIKETVKGLEDSGVLEGLDFERFNQQLEEISKMDNIGDPCTTPSSESSVSVES